MDTKTHAKGTFYFHTAYSGLLVYFGNLVWTRVLSLYGLAMGCKGKAGGDQPSREFRRILFGEDIRSRLFAWICEYADSGFICGCSDTFRLCQFYLTEDQQVAELKANFVSFKSSGHNKRCASIKVIQWTFFNLFSKY